MWTKIRRLILLIAPLTLAVGVTCAKLSISGLSQSAMDPRYIYALSPPLYIVMAGYLFFLGAGCRGGGLMAALFAFLGAIIPVGLFLYEFFVGGLGWLGDKLYIGFGYFSLFSAGNLILAIYLLLRRRPSGG